MAVNPDKHELFENHEYLYPLDIRVKLDYINLLELLDAPNQGVKHLGELAIGGVELPSGFDREALQQELTMQVQHIRRKTDIDNQVVTSNTSWFRDNDRSDVIRGRGSLIVPDLKSYTLPSLDGKTLIVPSETSFSAMIDSWPFRNSADRVLAANISLLRFSAEPKSD
jgi:hypothetical protein